MTAPLRPLVGIRVLDLSRYLPGPLLTRILCDLGAEVFKIEPPGGDTLRTVPPMVDGVGAAYASVNAGKASIALDLRSPQGQAVVAAMLPQVDVLVESYRPGVLDRFGLDAARREALNPALITVSLSGYGQDGPLSARAGHDLDYLARAGILSLFGPPDRPPQVPGAQLADVAGGALPAAVGVLAALMERQQTGQGRHLDLSLTRGAMALGGIALAAAAAGATEPRGAGFLTGGLPGYRCYRTADGRHLAVGALEPHFFASFCQGIGRPELVRSGYATGPQGDAAAAEIAAAIAEKPLDHWLAVFEGHDVCVEPVLSPTEALAEQSRVVGHAGAHTVIKVDVGVEAPDPTPVRPLGADGVAACRVLGVPAEVLQAALDSGALAPGRED